MTIVVRSKIKLPSNKKYQTGRLKALFEKTAKRVAAANKAMPKMARKLAMNSVVGSRAPAHPPRFNVPLEGTPFGHLESICGELTGSGTPQYFGRGSDLFATVAGDKNG